jgi:hypothetical protein
MEINNQVMSNEELLVTTILEMQVLLKKLRCNDFSDQDEFFKAINYAKDELYKMWKEMGKEN